MFDFSKEPGRTKYNRDLVTTEKPLVSVITPYYNAQKYFAKLYPCVLNQTFPWFEWIIVDDGSNATGEDVFLKKIEESDPRIKVVHKTNGGISSARNRGIRESDTDIVITLDADELIEPTYFELLYWTLYYNPKASWAYTDSVGFQNQEYVWQFPFNAEKLKTYNFLVESAAIRKKDLIEVGGYDEVEKHYFEDWRLWLKMLSKGKMPVHVSSLEFWYRRTDTGVLNKVTADDKTRKMADELISEVAATADDSVTAKVFNGLIKRDEWSIPNRSDFNKRYRDKNDKIEVLFIIPWMVTGGADQFNLDFVRLLNKEKYNITIITTEKSENPWKQRFREYTPSIYSLPDFLDVNDYAEFISYIIQTRQIDVCLVSNSYYGYYILPWLKLQYPKLAIIDYVHMEEMYWRNGGYARTSMAMSDIIEKTYVCNNSTQRAFVTHFKRREKDVETLYIGVDQQKYDPDRVLRGTIRAKYNIPDNGKIVLFPCRLHQQKRPYLMLEIAKKVASSYKNFYFLVVGDGDELDGMKKRVSEYKIEDRVIFAGMQEDVRPYYKDADVTLICSLREGLSLTAYESCAMMTPVITADVGGQRELIDDSVGMLLPFLSEEKEITQKNYSETEIMQYVKAILDLLDNDNQDVYRQKCINCRKKIEDNFGLDTMIKHMEEALDSCLRSDRILQRESVAKALAMFPTMTEDILSIYLEYEGMMQENGRIWNERCHFQNELNARQYELNLQKAQYDEICGSTSLRVGRWVTFIPRKLKGGIRCIYDHGLLYTVRYAFLKIMHRQVQ